MNTVFDSMKYLNITGFMDYHWGFDSNLVENNNGYEVFWFNSNLVENNNGYKVFGFFEGFKDVRPDVLFNEISL